jgi:hypothetical protein
VWEDYLRESGSYSNSRMYLNWTQHDTRPVGRIRSICTKNDDCGRLRHDMDLRFDAYESRL